MHNPGGASLDETPTLQNAEIFDSGTQPSVISSQVSYFLDYLGDKNRTNADYKITDHNAPMGDWAPLSEDNTVGDLHYQSLSECNSSSMCTWRHAQAVWRVSVASCGKDLYARGNHSVWFSGTSISVFGIFTVDIVDPSLQVPSTDVAASAAGSACPPPDQYIQGSGSGGSENGSCPEEDVYMWFHNGVYVQDVCYQNGIITPLGGL